VSHRLVSQFEVYTRQFRALINHGGWGFGIVSLILLPISVIMGSLRLNQASPKEKRERESANKPDPSLCALNQARLIHSSGSFNSFIRLV